MLGMEEDPSEKDLKNMNATVFPPLQRIIHHIITTIFFSKGGSRNEVTKVHKTIFHCLFNGELMSLPHLMCTLIDKVHFQVKRALPYVAHLTAVFQFARVDLSSHQKIIIPLIHVYNKFNICSHMGYKLVDGQFARTLGDEEGGSESDEEGDQGEPQAEPPAFEGGSDTTSFQGCFDRLEEAVGFLRGEVHQVDARIDGLTDRVSSMETRLMGQLDSQTVMLQDIMSQLQNFHLLPPLQ